MTLITIRFVVIVLTWPVSRHLSAAISRLNGPRLPRWPYRHLGTYLTNSSHRIASLAYRVAVL